MKNGIKIFTCIGCGVRVEKSCNKTVKFCSHQCYQSNKGRLKLLPKKGKNVSCETCKKEFYKPTGQVKEKNFCSSECHNAFQSKKIKITCEVCGKQKELSPIFKNQKYCSISCRDKSSETKSHLIRMNAIQNKNKDPNKNEILGYECLEATGVKFERQKIICNKFCVDAYLTDYNTVIQFDGDYWHGNPKKFTTFDKRQKKRMALDISQDAYMEKAGICVIRVWESELKSDPTAFIERVKKHVSQLSLFKPEELTTNTNSLFD